MNYEPAELFGAWLNSQEWTHWSTLTFSKPPSVAGCRRNAERAFEKNPVRKAFWATEKGCYGRWHVHALLEMAGGSEVHVVRAHESEPSPEAERQAEALDRYWRKRLGFAQVERYSHSRGAAHYVSKYVTKDLSDYDLWIR